MNAVSALYASYDGKIPADEMARAVAQDAAQAANPESPLQAMVKMVMAEVVHWRGMVRSEIAAARAGTNPYARENIRKLLGRLRQQQAQLRALQVTA